MGPTVSLRCFLLAFLTAACATNAFTVQFRKALGQKGRSRAFMSSSEENPLDGGELTSTLARLDQQWKIQQRTSPEKSRWTTLVLPDEEKDDEELVTEQDPTFEPQQDFVYLLEPPNSIPSCVVVFLGGAGTVQFPQIAYNEFLLRVSNRLNAAVLTVPYQVGLDHFEISKKTGELLRRAMKHCQDDPARQYPESLPKYSLSHSLGAKLQTIYMVAMQQDFDGVGFLSYNNFGFSQTITMIKSLADQLKMQQPERPLGGGPSSGDILNSIFDFAEQAIGAIGLDFSPSREDMNRLIEMKYDADFQSKTRLFSFDNDDLDNSQSFVENCHGGNGPTVSGLPGTHLTPVYFQLSLDELPEEAREMASQAAGGFRGASLGNEEDLDTLVDEVCNWILGKPPSRGPYWDDESLRSEPPRIAGGTAESN